MKIGDFSELVSVSRRLGSDLALVQGGGGNTSLKTTENMWVKASGCALKNVTEEMGFVSVDYVRIKDGLSACQTEVDYSALLSKSMISGTGRPSIETGFHALLGTVVLHSHALLTNLLCCSVEGEELAKILLPDALWVPYVTPGLTLTKSFSDLLKKSQPSSIFLLQNHGLIVSGQTPEDAWHLHEQCCEKVLSHFKIKKDEIPFDVTVDADQSQTLFPDQAVYLWDYKLKALPAAQETAQAYGALRILIERLGLKPHYLPASEVEVLLNMESEKYRQKQAGI